SLQQSESTSAGSTAQRRAQGRAGTDASAAQRCAKGQMMQRSRSGFTLIEMLVVVAIITILGSLILAGLGAARKTANINQVKIMIKGLEAALERYEGDFNDYPPSDGDTTGMTGAENLYECLRTTAKSGDYLPKSSDYRTVENPKTGKAMFC